MNTEKNIFFLIKSQPAPVKKVGMAAAKKGRVIYNESHPDEKVDDEEVNETAKDAKKQQN